MRKSLSFLWSTCALSLCFVLPGGTRLLGQTVPLKTLPVKFDQDYGAAIARIGEGRLHQMDTTLVELPPGGQLAPHRHLAEEIIYIVSGKGYTTMWREGSTSRAERRTLSFSQHMAQARECLFDRAGPLPFHDLDSPDQESVRKCR